MGLVAEEVAVVEVEVGERTAVVQLRRKTEEAGEKVAGEGPAIVEGRTTRTLADRAPRRWVEEQGWA